MAYRQLAEMVPIVETPKPRGLVRANGSHCKCAPPGRLWCWWYSVDAGDRWYCDHGGAWTHYVDHGVPFGLGDGWRATQPEGDS
jgi:hypothetical protein